MLFTQMMNVDWYNDEVSSKKRTEASH